MNDRRITRLLPLLVPASACMLAACATTQTTAPPTAATNVTPAAATPPAAQRAQAEPLALYGHLPWDSAASLAAQPGLDNLRQITYLSEGDDFDPALDPTGQWLVFASTRHRPTPNLYLQQVNGSAVIRLTDEAAWDTMPVFSPDGKRIAFCSNRAGNMDIYLLSRDGGQPVQVTNDPAQDIHPSFSPDGKHLVYSTQALTTGQWEMVVVDLDNPAQKRYIGPGLFPEWSPRGDKIVFQRARQRGTRWFSIWTVDMVNGEARLPTELTASANAACLTPHWSPDGKYIVFCTVVTDAVADNAVSGVPDRPQQADVWVTTADGGERINLTHNTRVNTEPVWARDGTIYFVSSPTRFDSQAVWSLRPDRALAALQPAGGDTGTATASAMSHEPVTPAQAPADSHAAAAAPATPAMMPAPAPAASNATAATAAHETHATAPAAAKTPEPSVSVHEMAPETPAAEDATSVLPTTDTEHTAAAPVTGGE